MCRIQGAKCSVKRFEVLLYSGVVCEKVRGLVVFGSCVKRFEVWLYSGVVIVLHCPTR